MKRISSRMISLALVVMLCLSMLSTEALATGSTEMPEIDASGVYQIANAGNLRWFAALVSGDTSKDGITGAVADASGKLTADITIDSEFPTSGTLDLNGYTLTYTGKSSIVVSESETLTITDSSAGGTSGTQGAAGTGKLVLAPNITSAAYFVVEGSLTLQNITVTSTGTVLLVRGDGTSTSPCKLLIDTCTITTTSTYCVTTNASLDDSGDPKYSGVDITIRNSEISAEASDGDDCTVLLNVEGSLTIDNSTITGDRQTVVVRVGTSTITNSTLIVTGNHNQKLYTDEEWGYGNEFPSAALLVGNLNSTYYGDAEVTVTDTVITSENPANANAVYVESNADYSGSADLSGSKTEVTGTVTTGQSTSGNSSIAVSEGTYSADVSSYLTADVVASAAKADGSTTTYYTTTTSFANVIAAADDGTVTLYADITVDSALTIDDSLTIDLNGYELTISDEATLTISDGVTVTITDSTSDGVVSNSGTITNDGTIVNESTIINNGAIVNESTIINDGTIINNDTIVNEGTMVINSTLDTQDGEVIDNGTVTISGNHLSGKLTPTITTEPAAQTGLTYDGSAHALISEGTANGGTMYYSLTGSANDWSTEVPIATDAGTYMVYYKVIGDGNYEDYTPVSNSICVIIAQAVPTELTTPTLDAVTYSLSRILGSIALDSGWTWADDTIVPQAGSNSYTVYYAVDDDTNYDWSGITGYDAANHRVERTVTLVVNASPLAAPTGLSWSGTTTTVTASWNAVDHASTYLVQLYKDGSTKGSEVAVTGTGTTFAVTEAGSYTFTVTAVGEGNYSSSAKSAVSDTLDFYTVTWKNEGSTLGTDVVMSGTTPSYGGNTPTKAADDTYTYTFSGWSPAVGTISGDTVYTAEYSQAYVAPAAGECYSIDYSAETATAASGYELSTDGISWSSMVSITTGGTLYVRRIGDLNASVSLATENALATRPAAPDITAVNESWQGEGGGQITGVTTDMEYSADGITWTSCTGDTVDNLAAGTYYVRYKATISAFAGNVAIITIASGTERTYILTVAAPTFDAVTYGYTQPTAASIMITNTGNSDATITSVEVDQTDSFLIGGSGSTVTAGGTITTWTIQPAAGLAAGTYTAAITVTYDNSATATAEVSFTVNALPVAEHTHTTEIRNAKDATCTEDGYTGDEICTVCGETITTGETIPATGHGLAHVEAKAATDTENGNTEYWYCSVCERYFSDAAATTEISLSDTVVSATGSIESGSFDETESEATETASESETAGTESESSDETESEDTEADGGSETESEDTEPDEGSETESEDTEPDEGSETESEDTEPDADSEEAVTENSYGASTSPKTGDSTKLLLWIVWMMIGFLGLFRCRSLQQKEKS